MRRSGVFFGDGIDGMVQNKFSGFSCGFHSVYPWRWLDGWATEFFMEIDGDGDEWR